MIQAVTHGRDAMLCDHSDQRLPVEEILETLLVRLKPVAVELGCWSELQQLTDVTELENAHPVPQQHWSTKGVAQLVSMSAAIASPLVWFL